MFLKRYFNSGCYANAYFPAGLVAEEPVTIDAGRAEPVYVRGFNPNAEYAHEVRQALQRIRLWLDNMETRLQTLEESLTLECALGTPMGKVLIDDEGSTINLNVATWRAWVSRKIVTHNQSLAPICTLNADDDSHILANDSRAICVSIGAYAKRLDDRLVAGGL